LQIGCLPNKDFFDDPLYLMDLVYFFGFGTIEIELGPLRSWTGYCFIF